MYELYVTPNNKLFIKRLADNAIIPINEENRDFREFQEWNAQQKNPIILEIPFDLTTYKMLKINQINNKTQQLISQGFIYASNPFSLDLSAQTMWLSLVAKKDELEYPVKIGTLLGSIYQLADVKTVLDFTDAAILRGRYIHEKAAELTTLIVSAQSKEDVDAINDDRV